MEELVKRINTILDDFFPEKYNKFFLKEKQFFVWKKKNFNYVLKHINNAEVSDFDDLLGIDKQKKSVFENTLQFLKGYKANNVLLWGEKGCGKSSLIKSIIIAFKSFDLKLIEVGKDDFFSLEELFEIIVKLPYKFIIYLDDVSFTEEDSNFKTLKALLDGSLVETSDNHIIYATSNRRHLIRETYREDDEIHKFEAISEKISLSDRFGISWGFYKPDKDTYLKIAERYCKKFQLLKFFNEKDALRFAMEKGGFSGRAAYQYAISLFRHLAKG